MLRGTSSTWPYLLAWEEADPTRVSMTVLVDGLSLVVSQTWAVCVPGAGGSWSPMVDPSLPS